jgi:hypothetical protein
MGNVLAFAAMLRLRPAISRQPVVREGTADDVNMREV